MAAVVLAGGCELFTGPVSRERARYEALLENAAYSLGEEREAAFRTEYDPFRGFSGLGQAGGLVSGSEEEWIALWDAIQSFHQPKRPAPAVDFAAEMVVLFAIGSAPSSGYDARIRHVTQVRDTLFVLTERYRPAPDCFVLGVITAPSDARVVPRTLLPVVFLTAPFVRECDPLRTRPDW